MSPASPGGVGQPRTTRELREDLRRRVIATVVAALVPGLLALALSPAGGLPAALLDAALLAAALWLGRAPTPATRPGASMSANQVLLLLLATGGAGVLVLSGAGSRPLHGLAVAPFAMAAFALSSGNSRDLRSGVAAAGASLGVLSVADPRSGVMVACSVGLVVLVFGWIAVRELMLVDSGLGDPMVATWGQRPWGALVVVRLAVLAAVAALLMPSQPPARAHSGNGGGNTSPAGERGYAIAGSDGVMDLRDRGSLSADPVIDVPSGTPTLWAGSYLDTYDGSTWSRLMPSPSTTPRIEPLPPASSLQVPAGAQVSEVRRYVEAPLVYAPGPLLAVAGDPSARWYDMGTGSIAVAQRSGRAGPYQVEWAPPGSSSADVLASVHPPVGDPRWLQLPGELPARVRELARTVTAAATTTADKVAALEGYLRSHERYQLDSPLPGQGNDAVDAFLFRDHVGFCEQFASAETVLLRSLGIPARLVTGFGGEGAPSADGRRVYRNQDAHAWVQVGYPGERWVDSDPTAGSALAASSHHFSLLAWLKKLWHRLTHSALSRLVTAAGLVATALLVRGLVLLGQRRRRPPAPVAPVVLDSAAGQAYQRLLDRLAAQDRPRKATETVRDLLARLRAPDGERVAGLLESEWYGDGRRPTDGEVAAAVQVLDGLALEPALVGAP